MTSLPSTQLFLTLSWRTNKDSWFNCFSSKNNGQRRYKYLVLGSGRSYFVKKNTLILSIFFLKLIFSTCSSFWLTTYKFSLVDVVFNRQSSVYLWVQTVLFFSPTCSFNRMRHIDFIQGLLTKNEKKLAPSFNFAFRYIDDVLSLNNSRFWWFWWSHLSHWVWNKVYHRYR